MSFKMQARDSVSGAMVTWTTDAVDFAGAEYPGDGDPLHIAATKIAGDAGGGGGSFTAPTGTGLMSVTSGSMDVASRPVGAGFYTFAATPSGANLAALLTSALPASKGGTGLTSLGAGVATWLGAPTSANLRTAVATTSTGTGDLVFANTPTLVTPVIGAATGTSVALSSFVSAGTTPSTAGLFRVPYSTSATIIGTKDSVGTDCTVISQPAASAVRFGNATELDSQFYGYTVTISAGTAAGVDVTVAGVYALSATSTKIQAGMPIIGEVRQTSPYGVHGMTVKAMTGSTDVLTAAEYAMGTLKVTGSGTNVVKFPAATSDNPRAYVKYVWNAGSGTLAVQDTDAVAAAATLAAGAGAFFEFSLSSVKQLTAAFAVA